MCLCFAHFVCESLCVVVCFVFFLCVDGCICVVLLYTYVCGRLFVHYCVKCCVSGVVCLCGLMRVCVCVCCAKHLWLCVVSVMYGGVSCVMFFFLWGGCFCWCVYVCLLNVCDVC